MIAYFAMKGVRQLHFSLILMRNRRHKNDREIKEIWTIDNKNRVDPGKWPCHELTPGGQKKQNKSPPFDGQIHFTFFFNRSVSSLCVLSNIMTSSSLALLCGCRGI